MTARIHTWQQALSAVIRARWNQPFEWGEQDCVLFAAACVQAVTGEDPAKTYRGAYTTEAGAARVMAREGGLQAMTTAVLGTEIAPALAQTGDVGLTFVSGSPGLAICAGVHWLAPGPVGLVTLQLDAIDTAWRCA